MTRTTSMSGTAHNQFTPEKTLIAIGYGPLDIEIVPAGPCRILPVTISPEGGFIGSFDGYCPLTSGGEPVDGEKTLLLYNASLTIEGSALVKVTGYGLLATLTADGAC